MKTRHTMPVALVLALTAYGAASTLGGAPALPQPVQSAPPGAGTWADDCNLSKNDGATVAARPGSPKASQWTRTSITYQDRACRQVAVLDAAPSGGA